MDESRPNMQLLGQKIATTKGNVTASWRQRNLRSRWRVCQYELTTWLRQRRRRAISQWIGMILYGFRHRSSQWAFPKREVTQRWVIYERELGGFCFTERKIVLTHAVQHNESWALTWWKLSHTEINPPRWIWLHLLTLQEYIKSWFSNAVQILIQNLYINFLTLNPSLNTFFREARPRGVISNASSQTLITWFELKSRLHHKAFSSVLHCSNLLFNRFKHFYLHLTSAYRLCC